MLGGDRIRYRIRGMEYKKLQIGDSSAYYYKRPPLCPGAETNGKLNFHGVSGIAVIELKK